MAGLESLFALVWFGLVSVDQLAWGGLCAAVLSCSHVMYMLWCSHYRPKLWEAVHLSQMCLAALLRHLVKLLPMLSELTGTW